MARPTTPATQGPEWKPMRSWMRSCGRCGILNTVTPFMKASDRFAISLTCLMPLRTGRPLTTSVSSPTLST